MKYSSIGALAAGMALGAGAVRAYGMMSRSTRRRLRGLAMRTGRALWEKTEELLGR